MMITRFQAALAEFWDHLRWNYALEQIRRLRTRPHPKGLE